MAEAVTSVAKPGVPAHWRLPLAALAATLVLTLLLHARTATDMVAIWSSSNTYTHGFVVPPIVLWLIWRIRHELAPLVPRASASAAVLMLGAAGVWLLGDLGSVNAVTQLALVAMLVLAVPTVLGWAIAWAMAFPLAFLFFAVPLGDFLLPTLMEWTADFTVLALRATGVPVYREGLQFVIPSGAWSVVEACSGIRFLISSITIGCLFAYLSYRGMGKRIAFVVVAIGVSILANWLRAYMIVMIGHLSSNELATGVDHLVYGWVFFGIVNLAILFIGVRWADAPAPASAAAPGAARLLPQIGTQAPRTGLAALAVLLIAALPHGIEQGLRQFNRSGPVAMVEVAAQAPWQAGAPALDWVPAFNEPAARSHQAFANAAGQTVGLHLTYYRQQDAQRKLVNSQNQLVTTDDPRWAPVSRGATTAQAQGRPLPLSTGLLRTQGDLAGGVGQRVLVWHFYWVNDRFVAGDARGKLHSALGRLRGWGDDGAHVAVYVALDRSLTEPQALARGSAALDAWLQAHGDALAQALRATRGER